MKASKIILLPLCLLVAMPTLAGAQSLDSILAKNYEARGGLDKIKSVNTMQAFTKMNMQGMEIPMIIFQKRPGFMRSEIAFQGQKIVSAFDGISGWMVNPMTGSKDTMEIPAEQLKTMKQEADMDGELVDWKAKGHTAEYAGKEDIEGADAFHIRVTLKDSSVKHIYIDADSYLEIQRKGKVPAQGKDMEITTSMGNYKKVEGMMIPFSLDGKTEGKTFQSIVIDSIKFNVPMPDSLFVRTAASKK